MAKRANNFNSEEVKELLQIVNNYKEILENKKTDRVTVEDKNKAWKSIEQDFNALFPEVFRAEKVLRTKYTNLKRDAKKNYAAERRELYKTGGGKQSTIVTAEDEMVKGICHTQQMKGGTEFYGDDILEDIIQVATATSEESISLVLQTNSLAKSPLLKANSLTHSPVMKPDSLAKSPIVKRDSWARVLKKPKNQKLRAQPLDDWVAVAQKKVQRLNAREQQQSDEDSLQMEFLRLQINHTQEEHKLRVELLYL